MKQVSGNQRAARQDKITVILHLCRQSIDLFLTNKNQIIGYFVRILITNS